MSRAPVSGRQQTITLAGSVWERCVVVGDTHQPNAVVVGNDNEFHGLVDGFVGLGWTATRWRRRKGRLDLKTWRQEVLPSLLSESHGNQWVLVVAGPLGVAAIAAFLREPALAQNLLGVIHVNPMRRHPLARSPLFSLFYRGFLGVKGLYGVFKGAQGSFESGLRPWLLSSRWVDAEDGFDYSVAAQISSLPASLYLYTPGLEQSLRRLAIALWLEDLGPHNVRMGCLDSVPFEIGHGADTKAGYKKVAQGGENNLILLWIEEVVERSRQVK